MNFRIGHATLAAFVGVFMIAPLIWMALDREPPYIRETGRVVPALPENCGIEGPEKQFDDVIDPGDCVAVNWTIVVKRQCVPNVTNNIVRRVQDSENVIHTIAPAVGIYGTKKRPAGNELNRYFRIPSAAAAGRALYKSTACFACNPLQHLFWPICISVPDVEFDVAPSQNRFAPRTKLTR